MIKLNDLATLLALENNLSVKEATDIIHSLFDIVKDEVIKGETVSISNFGLFEVKQYDDLTIKYKPSKSVRESLLQRKINKNRR